MRDHLNPAQWEAVRVVDRPVLVLAGAGSGKTRVITYKLAHLVSEHGLRPDELLAVTFTNKAAGEMRERAERMLGDGGGGATISTFHSLGLRILRNHARLAGREPGFVIYDAQDQETVVRRVMKDLGMSDSSYKPAQLCRAIEKEKRNLHKPGTNATLEPAVGRVYAAYEGRLRDANALDFTDLLCRTVWLFDEYPDALEAYHWRWRYILVDEFQDTNKTQYRLMRQLVERPDGSLTGLTVVGDDDQAIYGWRGADVSNILSFPDHFRDVHVVRLEQNYRSSSNILEAAGAVIHRNRKRHEKRLWTEADAGALIPLHVADSETREAAWIVEQMRRRMLETRLSEMAVFYRTNSQSRPIEEALRRAGLTYRVVGGLRFYDRAEIKDVLAYLRLLVNPADDVAFSRVVNVPRRGIGNTSLERLRTAASERGLSAYGAISAVAPTLRGAAGKRLLEFHAMMEELRGVAAERGADYTALRVLETTSYLQQYEDGSVESESRRDNVRELVAGIEAFCEQRPEATLQDYLDDVSLLTDLDSVTEGEAATLMTVHSAKGLEFDRVFVAGVEDGVFPHSNSLQEGRLEEERRLFYVALTRARHEVLLSRARTRRRFGSVETNRRSRFLTEMPPELLVETPKKTQRKTAVASRPASRPARSSDSVYYEPDPGYGGGSDAVMASEVIGRRVRHPTFGAGKIVATRDELVRVEFARAGLKTMHPRFLELE